ncbi:MAG: chorismate mutase [Intestinimonas sp.]
MSELDTLRSEIDEIDTQLTALFLRRMDVTARVGAYKQENGLPVLDEAREQEVLARKSVAVLRSARRADVTALYETIMGAQPSPAAQSGE